MQFQMLNHKDTLIDPMLNACLNQDLSQGITWEEVLNFTVIHFVFTNSSLQMVMSLKKKKKSKQTKNTLTQEHGLICWPCYCSTVDR